LARAPWSVPTVVHNNGPFDRLIEAISVEEKLTLVSANAILDAYGV
jgi:PIN domain nuclease of toxin-antitoxin system